jgi:hypothetical protein
LIEDGRLDVDDPEFAGDRLISLLKGGLFWPAIIGIRETPGQEERERIIAAAVDMFPSRYER